MSATSLMLTAQDAHVQLQELKRDRKTTLREHATMVEPLAQVAYGDLSANGRHSLALDAFLQSINNMGLKKHLLVAEVETMERALWLRNAYFQADSTVIQQIEADHDNVSPLSATAVVHVTTVTADEPTSFITSLVGELLAESRISANSRQLSDPLGRRQLSSSGVLLYVGVVVVVGTF